MTLNQIIFIPLLSITIFCALVSGIINAVVMIKKADDLQEVIFAIWLNLWGFGVIIGFSIGGIRSLIVNGCI